MNIKPIHVLFLFITLFNSASLWASETSDFAIAFVNSLSTMQREVKRFETLPRNNDMMSIMEENYVFTNRLEEAKSYIALFKKSSNKSIADAANYFWYFHDALIRNQQEQLDIIEEIMNSSANIKQGTLFRKIAENHAKTDKIYKLLPLINTDLALTLVDSNRLVDGKLMFLKLTREERASIKKLLLSQFGEKTLTSKASKSFIEASAYSLWDFLSKPLKSADEQ